MEENNQQIQIPQQVVNNVETSTFKKPKKKLVIIGIVIVALLLIEGSSFAVYQYVKKPQKQIVACTQEVKVCPDGSSVGRTGSKCTFAPCPTTTSDQTVNWKTYTNNQYGFLFKYPKNSTNYSQNQNYEVLTPLVENIEFSDSVVDPLTWTKNPKLIKSGDLGVRYNGINVVVFPNENHLLLAQYTSNYFQNITKDFKTYMHKNFNPTMKLTSVNDIQWYMIEGFENYPIHYYLTELPDGKVLLLNKMNAENKDFTETFNQILSTFKFIDTGTSTPSPTTSQKISCNTASDCPSGDTCTVWGPIKVNGPQNKYCTAPGQAVPL